MTYNIGIVIFDGVEELDFVGPWEVLKAAAEHRGNAEILLIAPTMDQIVCEKGMRILPDCSFDTAPNIDVVIVPGGSGARKELDNKPTVAWLRDTAAGCDWVTSVCTGAFLLVGSGLAQGARVTTHHDFVADLENLGMAEVVSGTRMVKDGNLVTAAGVMSGIEMSLWLAEEVFGAEAESYARRYIAYDYPPAASRIGFDR